MDEPFSAVDPIARGRLQEEFLKLQATVRKTIVLVTHDIDEAVRLGDRIAVLAEGGRLLQYAPPAELLSKPDSTAVADFVGADRGIRRLAVTPLRQAITPLDVAVADGRPTVAADGTLYDALAAMLAADAAEVVVADGEHPIGLVTRTAIFHVPEPETEASV
jgi:osmoprotectant transport system ATP-binding protein